MDSNSPRPTLQSELKSLRDKLRSEGFYKTPLSRRAANLAWMALLLGAAFGALCAGGVWPWLGLIPIALYYPQAAYVGHDVAHGQWVKRVRPAAKVLGFFCSLSQAFSVAWWKDKHDRHHGHPNGVRKGDGKMVPVDGDIDTAPWLVWDRSLIDEAARAKHALWLKAQRWALPALLAFSRFNWSLSGFAYALRHKVHSDAAAIVAHWVLFLGASLWLAETPAVGAAWFVCAQLVGGFVLGAIFVLNHTGMPLVDEDEGLDYYARQLKSTRNTPSNAFYDWLCGGLNNQLEHHFFPDLPRHHLGKIRAATQACVERAGFEYPSATNGQALAAVWKALGDAAKPDAGARRP